MLSPWYWICVMTDEASFVRALQRKSHLCIPFLEIARPQSQFPHSCFCERYTVYTYSQDRSTYFLQQNRQGIYQSLTDTHKCENWDCSRAIPFLGIFVSYFQDWFFTVWKRWLKVEHFRMMLSFSPGLCWECQHWAARTAGCSWLVLDGKRYWRSVHCFPAPDNNTQFIKGTAAKGSIRPLLTRMDRPIV
jgi:hypothetical protein